MNKNLLAIIGDLHLGIHRNSELWHKIAIEYGNWLKNKLLENNINKIIILGDIFHNREEVGVNTLHIAEQFFNIFNNFEIGLIVGNHDCYLKNSCKINSLSLFKGWKNIKIYEDLEIENINNKNLCFCSWGNENILLEKDINNRYDVLFGHFEINSFRESTYKFCENAIESSDLLKKSKLIFSGHFHCLQEREYESGKIIYTGNAFASDWSAYNEKKGVYILNLEDLSYKFIENNFSPKYKKLYLSKLDENIKNIENCFVKFIVDEEIEYDKLNEIINILNNSKPLQIEVEHQSTKSNNIEAFDSVELNIMELISEYVNNLENVQNKDNILKKTLELYEKSLNKLKIEE